MERREFLKITAAAVPLCSCFPASLKALDQEKTANQIEKRGLGRTGENLSIIGFGGVVVMNATPEQASQRVAKAIDYGVNYFDVAPSYGDAEIKLGPALGGFFCLWPIWIWAWGPDDAPVYLDLKEGRGPEDVSR